MTTGYWKWWLVVVVIAAISPSAASAKVTGSTLNISQEVFASDGNPILVANGSPVGGLPIAWQRCFPDALTCTPLPGTDALLQPGSAEPGTVFKASLAGIPDSETLTSRVWAGKVTSVTPPTISGTPEVGAVVTGLPGLWSGGWGSDKDSVTVMACKTATAASCDVVTGAWQVGDQSENRPISPSHKGWLLYAVNTRLSGDEIFPAILQGKTRRNPLLENKATQAISAALGPIHANKDYAVSIFKRAIITRKSVVLGRTRCGSDCKFSAIISFRRKYVNGYPTTEKHSFNTALKRNGRIVIRRSQIRGARSMHVTILDRGVTVAKRAVSLKRR